MAKQYTERRKYLRVESPIDLRTISANDRVERPVVSNLSPIGVRFVAREGLVSDERIDLTFRLPQAKNPVHMLGRVVWSRKASTGSSDDRDVGCEFISIEEDNKNTFLKFFCDLIYSKAVTVKKEG